MTTVDDVAGAVARWQANPAVDVPDPGDIDVYAHDCATRAEQLLDAGRHSPPDSTTAQICLLTKRPHAGSTRAVTAVIARLLAAGIHVHEVRRLRRTDDAAAVVKALYPTAHTFYAQSPASDTVWKLLGERFDNDRFTSVFGEPYSATMVRSGASAAAEFHLTEKALTTIWEEGRRPVSRETLAARYGTSVAASLVRDEASYPWFRGEWPLGIQRISPGLMAFAMRHEQLGDGRPVIVLNGHVPGLAELFGEGTAVIEAGLPVTRMGVTAMRRWVIGHDSRPESCEPGTIRRDAADGLFPLDADLPMDSRHNVVHSSDGLLAGAIEARALLGPEPGAGALLDRLRADGMTTEEVEMIILQDPVVVANSEQRTLSGMTRGMSLDECATTITRAFPPTFGEANGFASGLALSSFAREMGILTSQYGDTATYSSRHLTIRALTTPAVRPADLRDAHEAAGRSAIGSGRAAFVVPAGGTGGRFGSYDVPESHPSRQKAVVKAFEVDGAAVCGLDIRLANARHWRAATGGRLPVAVMASPTSRPAVSGWAADTNDRDLVVYEQTGVYRLRSDTLARRGAPVRWFDHVLRNGDGSPSVKPPGNLGTLTCLAIFGILDVWTDEGIEYLVVANGDDVGFRLDPRVLGMIVNDPDTDVIVAGVPWGSSGTITRPDGRLHVRIEDGWCVDETGRVGHAHRSTDDQWEVEFEGFRARVDSLAVDRGGAIGELRTECGWQVGIIEAATPDSFSTPPLFSTNQFYVRVSAIRRAIGLSGGHTVDVVRRFVDRQPFYAERKQVATDLGRGEALQLLQNMNDVFRHLRMRPVQLSRYGPQDARGSYAALKRTEDVAFGQSLLNVMAKTGDDLAM